MTKLPDNAKRVFKGILFDVYQWEQTLFDGSTATFEAIKRLGSVQLIALTPENKIILLNEEQPFIGSFISVPGGQIEENEEPEDTAKKELLEELGMKAESLELWRVYEGNKKIIWPTYYIIARDCVKVQEPELEPGEKI